MWFKRINWPDLPLWLGVLVTFAGGVLLGVQLLLGAVAHGKQMKLFPAIYGVTRRPVAALTVRNVLAGDFQRALAVNIGALVPYFPLGVRVRNQLDYSLFGVSATPSVLVGTDGILMERFYTDDYCGRNLARFLRGAPAAAARIRQMQDRVEARGQVFLYVVTPSKVATYPWIIPPGLPCPSGMVDRTQLVPAWLRLVQTAGVHVVDTVSLIQSARGRYPFMLFPNGGTHWDQVGSAIGTQAVEAALLAQTHDPRLAPLSFTWKMSPSTSLDDVELSVLMNLMWAKQPGLVPAAELTQAPAPAGCRKIGIAIVAGSFMEHLAPALSQLPCVATVVEYFYWTKRRDLWVDGQFSRTDVDPNQRTADLNHADVILFEENESLVARSEQAAPFYAWLMARR